jgi:hypothetical protein
MGAEMMVVGRQKGKVVAAGVWWKKSGALRKVVGEDQPG